MTLYPPGFPRPRAPVAFRREIAAVWALNILDSLLTLLWLRFDLAEEWNPLMAWAQEMGGASFFIAKLALGTLWGVATERGFEHRWVRWSTRGLLAGFVLLNLGHFVVLAA